MNESIPKEVESFFECLLLHKRIPIVNKDYKIDWLCEECKTRQVGSTSIYSGIESEWEDE